MIHIRIDDSTIRDPEAGRAALLNTLGDMRYKVLEPPTDSQILDIADAGGCGFVVVDGLYEGDESEPVADIVPLSSIAGYTGDEVAWTFQGDKVIRFMDSRSESYARTLLESARKLGDPFPSPDEVKMDLSTLTDMQKEELLARLYNTAVGEMIFRLQKLLAT